MAEGVVALLTRVYTSAKARVDENHYPSWNVVKKGNVSIFSAVMLVND